VTIIQASKFQLQGPPEKIHEVPDFFGEAGLGAGAHFP